MADIEGYKVVPLRMQPDAENCHSIFMKEHFIRLMDPNKPKGRTLFLLNVPPYVTKSSLKRFFNKNGIVVSVSFAEKPGREETNKWAQVSEFTSQEPPFKFKVAYVVFKTTNNVERALQITSIDLFDPAGQSAVESGMQLWHSQYTAKFLDTVKTQSIIDEYMAAYDKREKELTAAAKTTEADTDGWVTVGKHGRNSGFEQKDSVIGKLEKKLDRGKKKKVLTNFYTFQIRESKMKNIIELRKKFEDDKKRIESLKQSRRFKPF